MIWASTPIAKTRAAGDFRTLVKNGRCGRDAIGSEDNRASERARCASMTVLQHTHLIPDRRGGVDGRDLETFFGLCQAGSEYGDVNFDGGVDGADIETFITSWAGGGCS